MPAGLFDVRQPVTSGNGPSGWTPPPDAPVAACRRAAAAAGAERRRGRARGHRRPAPGLPPRPAPRSPSAASPPCPPRSSPPRPGSTRAKLRKDLSHLGSYGTRGVGYDVDYLVYQIARELGLTQDWPVVIVGVGNLGHALANYGGFATRGFRSSRCVDADPRSVGEQTVGRRSTVHAAGRARAHRRATAASCIGVIATPAAAAQEVCDRLVAAGVTQHPQLRAGACCTVPDGVDVRKVDLAIELQILAFHEQRKQLEAPAGGARPRRGEAVG